MSKYRGSRKNDNIPSNPRLFTVSTGASSDNGNLCPCNAARERASEAGPGQGPLKGSLPKIDRETLMAFLKKSFDDAPKIVICESLSPNKRAR